MKFFFLKYNSKIFPSVKILHGKMKTGANLALTRWFSKSNAIGLMYDFDPAANRVKKFEEFFLKKILLAWMDLYTG